MGKLIAFCRDDAKRTGEHNQSTKVYLRFIHGRHLLSPTWPPLYIYNNTLYIHTWGPHRIEGLGVASIHILTLLPFAYVWMGARNA